MALPFLLVNGLGLVETWLWLVQFGGGGDWVNLSALTLDDPYSVGGFRWSPPAAWIWVVAVLPLGLLFWQVIHAFALLLVRDWTVLAVALVSWAYWQDLANGNIMTFVVLSAWWTMRGNTAASVVFVGLCVLVPRPLMLPVLVWLLWQRPAARVWLIVAGAIVLVMSLAAGQADDWLARSLATGRDELSSPWNVGPSRLLGAAWIPIGVALGAALAWRGWLGLASVVVSPYVFPYYLLMLLLDLPRLLERVALDPDSAVARLRRRFVRRAWRPAR